MVEAVKIEPAYLAGVMDSDGSFTLSKVHTKRKNPSYVPTIQITWLKSKFSFKVLNSIKSTYGGSLFDTSHKTSYNLRFPKPMLKYHACSKSVLKIINDIYPFLKLKKPQAKIIKTFILFPKNSSRPRHKSTSKKYERLKLLITSLNHKNKK